MKTKMRVLVAVKPEPLSRVIFQLLATLKNVDVVCFLSDQTRLVRYTERLLPHMIIVNSRFVTVDAAATIDTLRNASPQTKVILTSGRDTYIDIDGQCTVDARLDEDLLADQLIPTVRRLCAPRNP